MDNIWDTDFDLIYIPRVKSRNLLNPHIHFSVSNYPQRNVLNCLKPGNSTSALLPCSLSAGHDVQDKEKSPSCVGHEHLFLTTSVSLFVNVQTEKLTGTGKAVIILISFTFELEFSEFTAR